MNIFDASQCKCRACEGHFLLAQFYYDTEQYDKAWRWYSKIQTVDLRGIYFCLMIRLFCYLLSSIFAFFCA